MPSDDSEDSVEDKEDEDYEMEEEDDEMEEEEEEMDLLEELEALKSDKVTELQDLCLFCGFQLTELFRVSSECSLEC